MHRSLLICHVPQSASTHLSLKFIRYEVADFFHCLLDLGLCGILLQDAIYVAHGHLAHVTEATSLKFSLLQHS